MSNDKNIYTHPLDDDGFVDKFLDELSELTNKWGLVVETDNFAQLYLDFMSQGQRIGSYSIEYDYEKNIYIYKTKVT